MSHNIIPGFCQFRPDQRVPVVMVHAMQPAGQSPLPFSKSTKLNFSTSSGSSRGRILLPGMFTADTCA